jgi:hypothetical protein
MLKTPLENKHEMLDKSAISSNSVRKKQTGKS